MLKDYHIVQETSRLVGEAASKVVDSYRKGKVEHEPAFTDRLAQAIEDKLDGVVINGVKWEGKTLTDRGSASQEKEFGADLMGVMNVNVPGYEVSKGFLAQAKRASIRASGDRKKLVEQCERMLKRSPVSYVFLYDEHGVKVVSATSVVAAGGDVRGLYAQSIAGFFEDHVKCAIGDPAIHTPNVSTLDELRLEFKARRGLLLSARVLPGRRVTRS